jgi:multiple antibiotic resistance protein
MDPVGNLSSYRTMVEKTNPKRRRWIVLREMLIALAAMLLFNFIGEYVLSLLQIKEPTVRIASGVILFLIAIKILFPSENSLRANIAAEEPYVTPLAIPLIAGPAVLATIMLYAITEPSQTFLITAIVCAWLLAVFILLLAEPIHNYLGDNGLNACERVLGMILILLAIQRTLEGVKQFIPLYCK